jgi:hypothetical protein
MTQRKTTPHQIKVRERQDQALHLRRLGTPWDKIAKQLGYGSSGAAYDAYTAAMSRVPSEDAAAVRELEQARLDQLTVELWDLYLKDCLVVSNGKVMVNPVTDQPLIDLAPKLAALLQLRQVGESRRKLMGSDAPTRKIVEVITEDVIDAEIRRLEAELGEGGTGVQVEA